MHGWSGCETCGGACSWEEEREDEYYEDEDNLWWELVNEGYDPDEMEEDMDTKRLMQEALDNFVQGIPEEDRPGDPRDEFWNDAHNLLVAVDYVLEANRKLGLLDAMTAVLLEISKFALEGEFAHGNRIADHQNEEPF